MNDDKLKKLDKLVSIAKGSLDNGVCIDDWSDKELEAFMLLKSEHPDQDLIRRVEVLSYEFGKVAERIDGNIERAARDLELIDCGIVDDLPEELVEQLISDPIFPNARKDDSE